MDYPTIDELETVLEDATSLQDMQRYANALAASGMLGASGLTRVPSSRGPLAPYSIPSNAVSVYDDYDGDDDVTIRLVSGETVKWVDQDQQWIEWKVPAHC